MLYRVRLQYGLLVDAANRDEAYAKALRRLRENPETAIAEVQAAQTAKKHRPLWKQLLTGR